MIIFMAIAIFRYDNDKNDDDNDNNDDNDNDNSNRTTTTTALYHDDNINGNRNDDARPRLSDHLPCSKHTLNNGRHQINAFNDSFIGILSGFTVIHLN